MIEYLFALQEFVMGKQFTIPLSGMLAYVSIMTFCLLFGRHSLGLVISYCFVFYWGFVLNMHSFIDMLNGTTWGLSLYAISGFAMFIIALTGFFIDSKE